MSSSSPIRFFVLVLIFNEVTSSTYLDLFIFICICIKVFVVNIKALSMVRRFIDSSNSLDLVYTKESRPKYFNLPSENLCFSLTNVSPPKTSIPILLVAHQSKSYPSNCISD